MQNGMGAWQSLQAQYPCSHIVLATTTEGANRPAPGIVVHAGRGETFIGALGPDGRHSASVVSRDWSATQLTVHEDLNILPRLWQKLAINCAINPLTALYDCPNGELLNHPAALEQMQQVCKEVEQVMGLALDQETSGLFELAKTIAGKTANNISSMLQDVRKLQSTEIDYITGYLLSEAQRLGVECPRNEQLFTQVKSKY
jgi:2-dehydropantoate 2-reductase